MNIKSKLRIVAVLTILAYLVVGVLIALFLRSYQQSLQKTAMAQSITLAVFERRFLADEYVANHSERAKSQWLSKQEKLGQQLANQKNIFQSSEEKELMKRIEESIKTSKHVFSQLSQFYATRPLDISPTVSEKELRLSSQLSVKAQEAISAAAKLSDTNSRKVADNFKKIIWLFSASILLLFLILASSFRLIWRSANELVEQKNKDEAILKGIGDGIIVINRDWQITLFNQAAEAISGWSIKEALGQPFREIIKFVRERDRQENIGFIEKTMSLAKVHHMENNTVLIAKNKEEIPVGDSSAPLLDKDGQVTGAIIIFRDMTEERKASLLKSDFAYASHQFRTPINKALWGLEGLASQIKTSKLRTSLKDSVLALESARKLAEELLEISEIDQGKITPVWKEVAIDQLVEESAASVQTTDKKNLKIELATLPTSARLTTDATLLKRCLDEVLSNAILYSQAKAKIQISVESTAAELIIKISDTGLGIPQQEQDLIFHKFFRGSNFNTTTLAGGGLGLYMAKSYINLLKGKIWFDSQSGSGTTFFVALPKAVSS